MALAPVSAQIGSGDNVTHPDGQPVLSGHSWYGVREVLSYGVEDPIWAEEQGPYACPHLLAGNCRHVPTHAFYTRAYV